MLEYSHTVSVDWLLERYSCVTATDIVSLWPSRAALREWAATAEDYSAFPDVPDAALGLAAGKLMTEPARLEEAEKIKTTTGAQARGHLMEAQILDKASHDAFHWDDCLVAASHMEGLPLAFSPDGLDVIQPWHLVRVDVDEHGDHVGGYELHKARRLWEAKCYTPKHFIQVEKRWTRGKVPDEMLQMIVGAAVLPQLRTGTLVVCCPELDAYSLYEVSFTRPDTQETIAEIRQLAKDFSQLVQHLGAYIGRR